VRHRDNLVGVFLDIAVGQKRKGPRLDGGSGALVNDGDAVESRGMVELLDENG
jgi:hypothetical protein